VEDDIFTVTQKINAYVADIITAKNNNVDTAFLEERLRAAETRESYLRNKGNKLLDEKNILLQVNIAGTYILL